MRTLTVNPQPEQKVEESTDLSVFVRTSTDDIVAWDKEKIVEALAKETGLNQEIAGIIAIEVEKQVRAMAVKNITAPLIRELVDVKLLEYGLEEARRKHTRLGVPVYDVNKIIFHKNKENANTPHSPEATNLTLAENIKKEYALLNVFSLPVADAHMAGEIHLHDLGFVDRPYCSGQSIEYVKKFGLDLPDAGKSEKPAGDIDELVSQIVKFSIALHGHFAGAIGWDAVNMFVAPFLEGLEYSQIKKTARSDMQPLGMIEDPRRLNNIIIIKEWFSHSHKNDIGNFTLFGEIIDLGKDFPYG